MLRSVIRDILTERQVQSSSLGIKGLTDQEFWFLYKNLKVIEEWFWGTWMDKKKIPTTLIKVFQILQKISPSYKQTTLYRVAAFAWKNEIPEDRCQSILIRKKGKLIQTSNKPIQSWTTDRTSAMDFYRTIRRMMPAYNNKTNIWAILTANIPKKNILFDSRGIISGLKALLKAVNNETTIKAIKSKPGLRFDKDPLLPIEDTIYEIENYTYQKEVIIYLPDKKVKVKSLELIECYFHDDSEYRYSGYREWKEKT